MLSGDQMHLMDVAQSKDYLHNMLVTLGELRSSDKPGSFTELVCSNMNHRVAEQQRILAAAQDILAATAETTDSHDSHDEHMIASPVERRMPTEDNR